MSHPSGSPSSGDVRRREFLTCLSAMGLGATLFPGVLYGMAQDGRRVTASMIEEAEKVSGLSFTEDEREMMARNLSRQLGSYEELRKIPLANAVAPALYFDPVPAGRTRPPAGPRRPPRLSDQDMPEVPGDLEELAFLPVTHLSKLVQSGAVTSTELTEMYLERLKRHDESLHCVVTLTEELAMEQAAQADEEIEAGKIRGPLHGIPWGAKDLLNTRGIRTTYGAKPFEHQVLDDDATVVERLREAGAVLIAKLTLGALAMGDVWYGGKTRNPWNPEQGSSGSSAGPAAATAGGLVGFSIGTETLGSIVSPSSRCGVTGLRPTYGRVSRAGAMALSWSMDKIGPMCRSVEDCALVLDAIYGADRRDPTAADVPFHWDASRSLRDLKVGYLKSAFGGQRRRGGAHDEAALEVVRELVEGDLVEVELPDLPSGSMMTVLNAESATAFDEITRDGRVSELVSQGAGSWPNSFRSGQMIPAVEYLRANRVRTLLLEQMAEVMDEVDVFLAPVGRGPTLMVTNLTGHPCLVLPHGFDENQPRTTTFIGKLYGEADLLVVAKAFQDATDHHLRHPEY